MSDMSISDVSIDYVDRDDHLSRFRDSLSRHEWMQPKFWINHLSKTELAERHVDLLGCLQVMVCQSRQPMLAIFSVGESGAKSQIGYLCVQNICE